MRNRFDEIAREWDSNPVRVKLAEHIAGEIIKRIEIKRDDTVLDYGCGTGLILLALTKYSNKIYGFDNSKEMLKSLKEKLKSQNIDSVTLREHNGDRDSFEQNMFNLVTSSMTLHHIEDTQFFIDNISKSLKSGGYLAIADLIEEDGSFHSKLDSSIKHYGFKESDIYNLLKNAGLKDISIEIVYHIEKRDRSYPIFLATAKKS